MTWSDQIYGTCLDIVLCNIYDQLVKIDSNQTFACYVLCMVQNTRSSSQLIRTKTFLWSEGDNF